MDAVMSQYLMSANICFYTQSKKALINFFQGFGNDLEWQKL